MDNIDEVKLLKERASFIAKELDLNEIEVIRAEDYQGEDGRENSSLPLSPSIKFA